jgi:hypothetical protein
MLDHSCQVQRHTNEERGLDLYETPPEAVRALLRHRWHMFGQPRRIWEPACGRGNIVRVLEENGHEVVPSDIVDYGVKGQIVQDFFKFREPEASMVVTNPPFQWAEKFVRHALFLCPTVVMLLRLAFLESERRGDILELFGLKNVHVFRKRLPMMHRAGWEGKKANSGMAFAWFVWERGHARPTTIDRLSWER